MLVVVALLLLVADRKPILDELDARYRFIRRAVTQVDEHIHAIIHEGADLLFDVGILHYVVPPLAALEVR